LAITPPHALLFCAGAWLLLSFVWLRTLSNPASTDALPGKLQRLQVWLNFALLEMAVAGIGDVPLALLVLTLLVTAGCAEIAASSKAPGCVAVGVALGVPWAFTDVRSVAAAMVATAALIFLLPYRSGRLWQRLATVLLGLYAGLAPAALYVSRDRAGLLVAVLLALTISHFVDIASGFSGKGGRIKPLARLSPNKTVRGFAVGAGVGVALAVLLDALASYPVWTGPGAAGSRFAGLGLGLALWAITAAGDLVGSKVKRILGVKDYGMRLGPRCLRAGRAGGLSSRGLAPAR
jgi:CDP-diglyceride synthetase